jgi:hypothetical protein
MFEKIKGDKEKGGDGATGWESTKEVEFRQMSDKLEDTREARNATFEKVKKSMPWQEKQRAELMEEYDNLQRKADHQKEVRDWKAKEVRTERDRNIETWGANIPDSQARGAHGAEASHLKYKKERYEKAQKELAEIKDPKERRKAKKAYEKRGTVWTGRDDEAYREARDVVGAAAAEAYGRAKEKHYRELAQIKKAHPFKFRKKAKEMGITVQKKWDNPHTSLSEYRSLHFALEHLAPKKKGEKK